MSQKMPINQREKDNYIFTSERLGYRLIRENDFEDYVKLDSDPEIRTYFPNGTLTAEKIKENMKKNAAFFQKNGFGVFIAIELGSGEFVGRCGFGEIPGGEIEVGYVFLKKFWGKGFGTEALTALLQWAKQHIFVVDAIIAYTPVDHIASRRVMEKAGMRFYKKDIKDNQECIFYTMKLRNK